jgi:hypothetical protein
MDSGESGKGLFAAPSSHGLSLRAMNRRKSSKLLNEFAELIAEGATPGQAAVAMGYMPDYGRVLLGRIRKQLGAQAV